jgi:murein DD-endopeptidase MepM/ murein hydrolase activator NlpD
MRRVLVIAALVLVPCALWAALPLSSSGAPSARTAAQIQKRIDATRSRIAPLKGRERVLTTDITAYSQRIGVLQQRQNVIQSDLDVKREALARTQERLRTERARLARLKVRLARSRQILAVRLREIYKAGEPDVVTVILQSDGFADLLENTEFIRRINQQDTRIIRSVRDSRNEAHRIAKRLAKLETRQQALTAAVLARRNQVAGVRLRLDGVRAGKRARLADVKAQRQSLQEDLASLEKEQSKIEAALRKAQGLPGAQPIRRGSGNFIWPVNGPISGSFGEQRPGHIHAGIDIVAPSGTPIRAAGTGKVVLLGWTGGYGNYTCIDHGGGLSTCYGHQSGYATSNGASVRQGQVIGYVGSTGHSTGPHLHFEVRVNGTPVSPLAYL